MLRARASRTLRAVPEDPLANGRTKRRPMPKLKPRIPITIDPFAELPGGKRGTVPRGYWKDKNNLFRALDRAERQLGIISPEDWYSVTLADLEEIGFSPRLNKVQLADLLCDKYPAYKWEKVFLLKGRYAQQKRLEKGVQTLFPEKSIKVNARREVNIVDPKTGALLELDIYIPELKLGFEYQEKHHYISSDYMGIPLDVTRRKDSTKRELVASKGETLITVPCWWDGKQESLAATIKNYRPDLLTDIVVDPKKAIAEEIPPGFFDRLSSFIDDIGEPTTASFFTLSTVEPKDWWMFEKYDGVRGFWNPEKRQFYSRRGNVLKMPQEIIDSMPTDIFLDGELWFGRDNFHQSLQMVQRFDKTRVNWENFKYMVFDTPVHSGTYSERYQTIVDHLGGKAWKYIEVAPKLTCEGSDHLEKFFQGIMDVGGEGVILRDPKAILCPGRSPGYLKHKKFRDAEARIVGSVGAHQWECELPNGVRFIATAGTTEFARKWNPQVGDIVSFKHHGFLLSAKRPKLPTLYRMRFDLTWDDVIKNWKEQKPTPTALPMRRTKMKIKPRGFWKTEGNLRKFFIEFAAENQFDPLDLEKWDAVRVKHIVKKKRGSTILSLFSGSLQKALQTAFPEADFKFQLKPRGYWIVPANRRQFFCEFAAENRFDPLVPENWQNVTSMQIGAKQGGRSLLDRYSSSLRKALIDTFTELTFPDSSTSEEKEPAPPKKKKLSRAELLQKWRQFFTKFAEEKGFDPLIAQNWSTVTKKQVESHKGGAMVLIRFKGSLKKALRKVFPEVQFPVPASKESQQKLERGYWMDRANRRAFLDAFALEHGFNPSDPEGWASITNVQIIAKKGSRLLTTFGGSLRKALQDAYPEVDFQGAIEPKKDRTYWRDMENCRSFFTSYAQYRGFDPLNPANWASVNFADLRQYKGGRSVADVHGGLKNAIQMVYPAVAFSSA